MEPLKKQRPLLFLYNRKVLLSYYIKNEDCKGRDVLAVDIGPLRGSCAATLCYKKFAGINTDCVI